MVLSTSQQHTSLDDPKTLHLREKNGLHSGRGSDAELGGDGDGHGTLLRTVEVDRAARRKALLKLDLFLLPCVTIIYWLSFLDRANIGNARAAGLQRDLRITNYQYSIALTVTYVPYIIMELPLTLAMRSIGPHRLLPALVILWGTVTTMQGFVHNFGGLVAARFFLGATEGAILPGTITYLSTFYTRADMGKRIAFYFSATSLAGGFSGLLAAALINMDGIQGKPGWAWIFFIEGIFTVLCGVAALFILPRNIATCRYLQPEQKQALADALTLDGHTAEENEVFSWSTVASALYSPQVIFMCLGFFASGTTLFGLAYFAPTIVGALGYTGTSLQLHTVPPYACSAFVAITVSLISDRIRQRGLFIILAACVAIAGYAIYLTSTNRKVLYASLFLQVIGTYTIAPLQSTWMPNNLAPYNKRATGIVCGFIFTNTGGILSTWLFPTTESPRFHRGTSVLLGMSCSIVLWTACNMAYLSVQNKRKARELASGAGNGYSDKTGDLRPDFKYII